MNWIERQLSSHPKIFKKMELACEEALVNVINHSSKNQDSILNIDTSIMPGKIEVVIRDKGLPFNPLEKKDQIDPSLTLEEREVGGLGIFFILKTLDSVSYKRVSDHNVLTLVKFTDSSQIK